LTKCCKDIFNMYYYFVAALVVNIMTTVRAKLKNYIPQQVHTYSKDDPVFSSVDTGILFKGFKQLLREVFRLRLSCARVRIHWATHLVALSYHGVQKEQFSLFFQLIFQRSVFVTSYKRIHNVRVSTYNLWGRSVYKYACATTAKYFTLISTTYIGYDPAKLTGCYFSCLMCLEEEARNVYKHCSSLWLEIYPTFFLLLSSLECWFSIDRFF
jgi:hypothetical protein